MSKFQVGDEVRRIKRHEDSVWELRCAECGVNPQAALTVEQEAGGFIRLEGVTASGPTWDDNCFELAFPKPEGGPTDHVWDNSGAVIAELEQSSEMLRADLTWQNEKLRALQEQFDGVCAQLEETRENAKQLGADLEYSRHSWRVALYDKGIVTAILSGIQAGLHTINLGELASQLRGIAAGLDSQDNGADAHIARRASNLLELLNIALLDWKRL